MKKKILLFVLGMFLVLGFTNVYAKDDPVVNVNGVSVYNNSNFFNKSTNTLKLDNFDGDKVEFDKFPDGVTLTIELYGDNNISSGLDFDNIEGGTNGIVVNSEYGTNLIIKGMDEDASLTISDYENGITNNGGFIKILNVNLNIIEMPSFGIGGFGVDINNSEINLEKCYSYGIVTQSGNLIIKDSEVNVIDSDVVFEADGLLSFDNVVGDFEDIIFGLTTYDKDIKIINSDLKFVGKNDSYFAITGIIDTGKANLEIQNSDIDIKNFNAGMIFDNGLIDIKSSNIIIKDVVEGIKNSTNGEFTDINISDSNLNFDGFESAIYNDYGGDIILDNTILVAKNGTTVFNSYNTYNLVLDESYDAFSNLEISDSNITSDNIYTLAYVNGQGNVNISDSSVDLDNVLSQAIYMVKGDLLLKNCDANITTVDAISEGILHNTGSVTFEDSDVSINSTILSETGIFAYSGQITFKDSNVTLDGLLESGVFMLFDGTFLNKNSNLNIKATDTGIITNGDYTQNGGVVTIDAVNTGIISNTIDIQKGDVYFTNENSVPIIISSEENKITLGDLVHIMTDGYGIHNYKHQTFDYNVISKDITFDDQMEYEDFLKLLSGKLTILTERKISFDANGGSGKSDTIFTLLSKYTLPKNMFTAPEGKRFKGWSLEKNGEILGNEIDISNDVTIYAIWENLPSYLIIDGDNISFIQNDLNDYQIVIDGDFELFDKIEIDKLNLEKDVDYTIKKGSTIITFLESGIKKLNTLESGKYTVKVYYTNDKVVTGTLNVLEKKTEDPVEEKENNPETCDTVLNSVYLLGIAAFGIGSIIYYRKKVEM